MPYTIQTLNTISPQGLALLASPQFEVAADLTAPDAILLRSADLHHAPLAGNLLAVARAGAGVNNIPVTALTQRGVVVFNTPGANANAVKELVLAGMLLAARNLSDALHWVASQTATADLHERVEKEKKRFQGSELAGKTLLVVGLGAIGGLVAEAALKLNMQIIGYDPSLSEEAATRLPAALQRIVELDDALHQADYVSLHVPLLPATRHLMDGRRIGLLKPSAVLLNFSREGIVDDQAALEALKAAKLRYYVCDFPNALLLNQPRVLALPHLGASTVEAEDNCAVMAAHQLRDYLENGNIQNAVNFPSVQMERQGACRIALVHDNIPNMLGRISTTLAAQGYNIENLVNKSREAVAYTLLDLNCCTDASAQAALAAIEGVRRVRVLP